MLMRPFEGAIPTPVSSGMDAVKCCRYVGSYDNMGKGTLEYIQVRHMVA